MCKADEYTQKFIWFFFLTHSDLSVITLGYKAKHGIPMDIGRGKDNT
jgi:hypothetical protein